MFAGVAPGYDGLNHLLSIGIDRIWRQELVSRLRLRPDDLVLDLCCGMGDLALAIASRARCIAGDFTWEMLTRAQSKTRRAATPLALVGADALRLPFAAERFDAATVAFGVRNLESLEDGLTEIRRVLRPGGRLAILEFSRPTFSPARLLYAFYLHGLLPLIGRLVSRERGVYRYLADSIAGFPDPQSLLQNLRATGFGESSFRCLTAGVATIHWARKP